MTGVRFDPACMKRNCLSTSRPVTRGMCMSMMAMSMPPSAMRSSACSPSSASDTRCPARSSMRHSTLRLAAWSSATSTWTGRTLALCRRKGSSNETTVLWSSAAEGACGTCMGSSAQKWLPPPGLSSRPISPPSRLVRVCAIVVPSPVPPCCRARPESTCSNGRKIRSLSSSGMPMPVSRTEKRRRMVSPRRPCDITFSATEPASVNLSALCSKFNSIWVRCALSPYRRKGTSSSIPTVSERRFSAACGCSIFCRRCTRSCRLNSTCLRCNFPASMAEMSSTSSTSSSKVCAAAWMTSAYSFCSAASRVLCNSSDMPMMPFRGERNSWLMLARKRDLAAFARLASSMALRSFLSRDDRYSGIAISPTHSPQAR